MRKHKKSAFNDQLLNDLTISSATLTGLSGVLNRTNVTQFMNVSLTSENWPLRLKFHHESLMQV